MTAPRPVYPKVLEAAWLRLAMESLGGTDAEALCLRLGPAVGRLSDLFTTERAAGFERYADDPELLAAYGLFFFPQTFVRTAFALAECAARAPDALAVPADRPFRIADIGSGTGAAGLAAAAFAMAHTDGAAVRLTACDRSAASLDILRRLVPAIADGGTAPEIVTARADGLTWTPPRDCDLIAASFALNEFFEDRPDPDAADWISRVMESLRPGGLLLILEPATQACSNRLGRLRNRIAAAGVERIVAPCPHARPCPLLGRGGEPWCHEVRRWRVPDATDYINRRLHREIQSLKFSFLALQRAAPAAEPAGPGRGRLIAPLRETGGRILSALCGGDGAGLSCEVLTRHMSRADVKEIVRDWERGDLVQLDEPKVIGAGRILRGASLSREFGFAAREPAPPPSIPR
jgi:ribosomal protein RSM22 (predicted rRNA methylase)